MDHFSGARSKAAEGGSKGEEGFVDVVAPLIAHPQFAVVMHPGKEPLNGPALFAQTAAMRRAALGQPGHNLLLFQPFSVRLGVVASVAQQLFGAFLASASFSARSQVGNLLDQRLLDQRLELGDVIGVGAGNLSRQGQTLPVGQGVVLACLAWRGR